MSELLDTLFSDKEIRQLATVDGIGKEAKLAILSEANGAYQSLRSNCHSQSLALRDYFIALEAERANVRSAADRAEKAEANEVTLHRNWKHEEDLRRELQATVSRLQQEADVLIQTLHSWRLCEHLTPGQDAALVALTSAHRRTIQKGSKTSE